MTPVRFAVGEQIFAQGDPSDRCFKIVKGRVGIRLSRNRVMRTNESHQIATCGPGEIIGEMGVIDGGPRSASAVALEPTLCLAYSAEEILVVLQNDPAEALSYVRTMIRRVRQLNRRMIWTPGSSCTAGNPAPRTAR